MRRVLLIAALTVGCGSAPEKKAAAPPTPPVKDDTALLSPLHRTGAHIVPDHLLGKTAMPGGTIGDYEEDGRKYQLFIIETASAQDAAILLLDLKVSLTDPAYIAYMGGYFGTDAGKPVYVFAKLKYLAGVVGLPEDLADPVARQLAARLYGGRARWLKPAGWIATAPGMKMGRLTLPDEGRGRDFRSKVA